MKNQGGLYMVTSNKLSIIAAFMAVAPLASAQSVSNKIAQEGKKASALYTMAHGILEPAYFVPATFVGAAVSQLKNKGFKLAAKNMSLGAISAGAIILYRNKDNITLTAKK